MSSAPSSDAHAPSGLSPWGRSILGVGIMFLVLDILAVVARFATRHLKGLHYGWDDWLIVVGLLFYMMQNGMHFYGVFVARIGYHANQLGPKQEETMAYELTIIQYPYAMDLLFVRFSICALFLRIFTQKWFRITSELPDASEANA